MEHWIHLIAMLAGMVLLYLGGDKFVLGATRLAISFRLSQIVVGLVIVAFATSAPELIVSVDAAITNHSALAIGNVVGSNIANLFLVLGLCAMIRPIPIKTKILRFDKPVLIGSAVFMMLFLLDKRIDRWEAAVFLGGLVTYVALNLRLGRREGIEEKRLRDLNTESKIVPDANFTLVSAVWLLIGLAALAAGARLLVFGASNIARWWGISEGLIGLSIVAIGTSLPELTTGVMASFKKHSDLVVGNVVGSNIFNTFGIIGIAAMVRPLNGGEIKPVDLWVMIGTSILLLPIMLTGRRISRVEGFFMFVLYCGYILYRYLLL